MSAPDKPTLAITPTPWCVERYPNNIHISAGFIIATLGTGFPLESAHLVEQQHANAAHIVHCVNTHSQLLAQNAALRAAIDSALEYFEDREDVVDGSYGESAPNKEMALAQELRTAIGVSP